MVNGLKLPRDQMIFSVDELKKRDILITKLISWLKMAHS